MKFKTFLVSLIVTAGISAMPASAANLFSMLTRHDVEVVTDSDVYVQGLPTASSQNPVPYLAVATGFKDFGGIMAGIKEPPQKDVLNAITKTLATRGYQLATNKTPPKIIIVYAWGTMNSNQATYNNPDLPKVIMNRYQILKFLGGKKMGINMDPMMAFPELSGGVPEGLSLQNPRGVDFYEMAADDFYVIALTAYDLQEANKNNAKTLWTTKISCRSLGHRMDEVLPTMLSIAAPHIGQQMAKPLIVNADDRYKPSIEIGTAKVIENDVE